MTFSAHRSVGITKIDKKFQIVPLTRTFTKALQSKTKKTKNFNKMSVLENTNESNKTKTEISITVITRKDGEMPTTTIKKIKQSPAITYAPKNSIVCKINDVPCDLSTQLNDGDTLEFFGSETELGRSTLYHSGAHLLGAAILIASRKAKKNDQKIESEQVEENVKLVAGPPTSKGFYYDVHGPIDVEEVERVLNTIVETNSGKKGSKKSAGQSLGFERIVASHKSIYDGIYSDEHANDENSLGYGYNEFKRFFIRKAVHSKWAEHLQKEKLEIQRSSEKLEEKCKEKMQNLKLSDLPQVDSLLPFCTTESTFNKWIEQLTHTFYRLTFKYSEDSEEEKNQSNLLYFDDFCTGPHIPDLSVIHSIDITNSSGAHFSPTVSSHNTTFTGGTSPQNPQTTSVPVTRIYGIAFTSAAQKKWHYDLLEKKRQRNHKVLGQTHGLLYFSELAPGSAFFLPDGAHIYNQLIEFMRSKYKAYGIEEVISPNLYYTALWKQSGHWDNYKDDMFLIESENNDKDLDNNKDLDNKSGNNKDLDNKSENQSNEISWGLKPMNCPGHCLLFKSRTWSYKQLPVRYGDFGVLHRNELSGALSGLTRVRRFQQDDAHIFCAMPQIEQEILNQVRLIVEIYDLFNFTYKFYLSTRPEKYLGTIDQWDKAERIIKEVLNSVNVPFQINEGDGAFYGPKIDVILTDALDRSHQCGTIQLDFQLPLRFNLTYMTGGESEKEEDKKGENLSDKDNSGDSSNQHSGQIVMIHRAVLGSVERFFAILLEHFGMDLPFWLTPRHVAIIPICSDPSIMTYCTDLLSQLKLECKVKLFDSDATLNKRIRQAETEKYQIICVVGEKEVREGKVNVRKNKMNVKRDRLIQIIRNGIGNRVESVYTLMCENLESTTEK